MLSQNPLSTLARVPARRAAGPRRVRAALLAPFLLALPALPAPARAQTAPPGAPAAPGDTLRLSLADAVGRALRASDAVRVAEAQVDVTESQVDIARSSGLPQLRLTSGYTRVYESARGAAVGRFFSQPNTYTFSGNLSQTLFQGGRVFAGARAAGRLRGAARLTADETRAEISVATQRAYLGALLAARLADIQVANVSLAADRVTQVERFQGAGRAARYDVLRARVERANLEPLALQAQSDREIALLELKRLLDIPLGQPVVLTSALDPAALQPILASFEGDTADQGESRASVRAAELTAQARHDAITVARADLLPSVSVFAAGGYQAFPPQGFPTQAGHIETYSCPTTSNPGQTCTRPVGDWFRDLSAGIQVSWSLFDGLRTKGNIDLAQAQARLADLQLTAERKTVALEVARARAELSRARALYQARQQNAQESEEAFRLASLRYSRGLSTQLEVTDAQLAQLTAQTNQARAGYDVYLAAAELARALGRPVPLPPDVAAPARTASSSADKPFTTDTTSALSKHH